MVRVEKSSKDKDQTKGKTTRRKEPPRQTWGPGRGRPGVCKERPGTQAPTGLGRSSGIIFCLCWCPEPVTAPFCAPLPACPTELGGPNTQILQMAPD